MRNTLITLFIFTAIFNLKAQIVLDDFGRITLNTYVSEQLKIPTEAKNQLELKLKQIATNYGMAGTGSNPRFIITASVSITSKDIIAGPPQMIAQKMEITLFIGDAIDNKIYSNIVISSKGVGTNENKSFINAVEQINTKSENIQKFIDEAKNKLINYYNTQCELIIKKSTEFAEIGNYDEALYNLALIPDICEACYMKSLKQSQIIYKKKIDNECQTNLNQAKAIWASNPNADGATSVSEYLSFVNTNASCYSEVRLLYKAMADKLINDEKIRQRIEEENAKREFELAKQREKQEAELERERIQAYKEVAVEYARRQPTVVYRNIYWY